MANVQTYLNKFNTTIRRSYEDNSTLRQKRDLLLGDLRDGLRRYALHVMSKREFGKNKISCFS